LKGFVPWSRCLQQGRYVWLLVWWLSRRGINLQCNPSTMEATIVILFSVPKTLISSWLARSKELYTFFRWPCSQIARLGTWATQLTCMLSICFTCRLFNSILEVIVAVMFRHLINVYSGCLHFCTGSHASLYIIDVSRDWIIKKILQLNGTFQKTVEIIKIERTNMNDTRATN
jgi:hypothetical protein